MGRATLELSKKFIFKKKNFMVKNKNFFEYTLLKCIPFQQEITSRSINQSLNVFRGNTPSKHRE